MALANDNKKWPGTQSPSYSYDRNTKPIPQPPCNLESQHQFEDSQEYIEVRNDRWNAETPVDWTNHDNSTPGMGMCGDRQFSSNTQDIESTGYGKNFGLNVIEYGQSAASNRAETVYVDVSRADRGRDS